MGAATISLSDCVFLLESHGRGSEVRAAFGRELARQVSREPPGRGRPIWIPNLVWLADPA